MSAAASPPADNLILIGPMGAGKSSVARELVRLTTRRWTDLDRQIVRQTGLPITEIFARHGEEHFRELESEALSGLVGETGLIVATGGGIVTRSENIALLRALGCVVFLTADIEVLFERVSRNRQRPLLHTADPRATLRELIQRRQPLYTGCAHVVVDTSVGTHAEIAQAVLAGAHEFFNRIGLATLLL